MRNPDDVILDSREQKELRNRVSELAAAYTPEWRFDPKDPDVGSTLALLFSDQMAENIQRLNRLPEKYHTEFVNLMDLSLQPAYPASGVLMAQLTNGPIPGVEMPRGTRVKSDDGVVFETMEDVYITNARLTDVLSLSGSEGRIIPLAGELKKVPLLPEVQQRTEEEGVPFGQESYNVLKSGSFGLFDYTEPGIERNAMLMYHRNVFRTEPGVSLMILPMNSRGESLAEEMARPERWRWSYYNGTELVPFTQVSVRDGHLVLDRDQESLPVTLKGEQYHMVCLEALEPVKENLTLNDLRVASEGQVVRPQGVIHGDEEYEPEGFLPFGDTARLYDECYICDDRVFSQQSAQVTMSFRLSSRSKLKKLTIQQEQEELKVIKPKPVAVQYQTAHTSPQRITMEYFNGAGWRKLSCSNDGATMMDGSHTGNVTLTFQCPEDWLPLPVGAYQGRCMRLRITQADDCYLLPCEHLMPYVEDLSLSYCYTGTWKQPQILQTICGTQLADQSRALLSGEPVTVFRPLPYPAASLYLGFDRPLSGAPISILVDVQENVHFHMDPVEFEYSTRTGFKPLKVVDRTRNFSGTGTLVFMPPSDFAPMEVEGQKRWWLRLMGRNQDSTFRPTIRTIALNALDIRNQQTMDEESFRIEAAKPNMSFPLTAKDILSAEVFVNELGQYSRIRMQEMERQDPENIRIEYDYMGEITSFFVRWTEVSSFDSSHADDRHYTLDRLNNTINFGDGVHVRVPQGSDGVAFTVRCVSCDGARGNLPAGAVNRLAGNIMFVDRVFNPVDTFAGSNLETLDDARRRGADMLSSRGRLISHKDFVRAVRNFSSRVDKVKCVPGRDIDGRYDPSLITIALMTKDYREGAYAFNNIRGSLLRHLMDRCDATITPNCLILSEPVYVKVGVTVWAKVDESASSFDVQNLILEKIREFLEPMAENGNRGWDIGTLPKENQLKMLLLSLRFQGHVERIIATAQYTDQRGVHEASLDNLPDNPFLIAVNGDHHVYIEF